MIDKLLKFLPIGTLIIIFCGFTKLFIYYSIFRVDITPYLTLSDLFNLFLSDAIYIAIILSGPIFYLIKEHKIEEELEEEKIRIDERNKVYTKVINDFKKINEKLAINVDDTKTEKAESSHQKRRRPIFTITAIVLLAFFVYLIFQKQTINITYSYLSFATLIPVAIFRSLDNTKLDLGKYFQIVSFSVALLFLVFARINLDYFNSTNPTKNIEIKTLSGEIYSCGKELLRIGNTENYMLLFNVKNSSTLIIRNDNIKEIKSTVHNSGL